MSCSARFVWLRSFGFADGPVPLPPVVFDPAAYAQVRVWLFVSTPTRRFVAALLRPFCFGWPTRLLCVCLFAWLCAAAALRRAYGVRAATVRREGADDR